MKADLTLDDVRFLREVFAKAPIVEAQCIKYLQLDEPVLRHSLAVAELQRMPRTGYAKRLAHIPGIHIESVAEHKAMMSQIHIQYNPHLGEVFEYEVTAMISIHDLPEAVVTDLTPQDLEKTGMTRAEKQRLETIGMKILYKGSANAEENLMLFDKFNRGEGPSAQWVGDLDVLSILYRCLSYEHDYGKVVSDVLGEFWNWAEGKCRTARGQEVYTELKAKRAEISTRPQTVDVDVLLKDALRSGKSSFALRV